MNFYFRCILLFLITSIEAFAQDPNFSMFYHNPTYYNPAMTAIGNGFTFRSNYRSLWTPIPSKFNTFSVAFEAEAVNKIGKSESLSKANFEIFHQGIQNHNTITRLALNTLEKIHIIEIADIIRCESSVNYTTFYLADKTRLMVTKTLKEYDELLTPLGFIRVHQTHLVNAKLVKEFVKTDGGYLLMKDGSNVPVSTRKKQAVVEALSII